MPDEQSWLCHVTRAVFPARQHDDAGRALEQLAGRIDERRDTIVDALLRISEDLKA